MPDKTLKTISGTQISALFDCNPYVTHWLLWRVFSSLDELPELDNEENERMQWGLLLERAIFDETLRRLNVEGEYNAANEYVRHDTLPIGATPDGLCFHPSRGMAVVQVKNVDWLVWKDKWSGDQAPAHIELQLQHEMLVKGAEWGVIACLVGGNELHLYEREPNKELQADMTTRCEEFFAHVKDGQEPDPLGVQIELPKLLEIRRDDVEVIDLQGDERVFDAMQAIEYYTPRAREANAGLKKAKALLLAKSDSADLVLGHGYGCKIKVSPTDALTVELPADIIDDLDSGITDTAIAWSHIIRKASHRTTYKVYLREPEGGPSWLEGFDNVNPLMG